MVDIYELNQQILTLYNTAKILVAQKNAKDARAYVLAFAGIAKDIYHLEKSVVGKAKSYAFVYKWVTIAKELRERGITDEVLSSFGLIEKKNAEVILPKVKIQPVEHEKKSSDGDLDELFATSAKSQGWCADIFEKHKNTVIRIKAQSSLARSSGTGFVISQNGFILTNHHVVYDTNLRDYYENITMSFFEDNTHYKLQVIDSDKKWDVALCRFDIIQKQKLPAVIRIKDYDELKQGADVLLIGNGFSMGVAPFTGIVRFTHDSRGDLVYTAPSNPGDSGGPVFNRIGECIGIHKSSTQAVAVEGGEAMSANGLTNATPMDEIEKLLDKWIKKHNIFL